MAPDEVKYKNGVESLKYNIKNGNQLAVNAIFAFTFVFKRLT